MIDGLLQDSIYKLVSEFGDLWQKMIESSMLLTSSCCFSYLYLLKGLLQNNLFNLTNPMNEF